MKKFLFNSVGSTLINVMIAGAAVAAGGVYMMSTMEQQKSISKKAVSKGIFGVIRREVAESLSNGSTCLSSLEWGVTNTVTGEFPVASIKTATNQILYDNNTKMYGYELSGFKFEPEDFQPKPGYKFHAANLTFLINPIDRKSTSKYTVEVSIPLFTMMTDNKITSCLSNDAGSVSDAYKSACETLGGSYQEGEGICLGLHGKGSYVETHVRDYFCSSDPSNCASLPLAGQVCQGPQYVDVRGDNHNNWVVAGFDSSGNIRCQCLPLKTCPTPSQKALYCETTDLGTNGCNTDCGSGTKTDGACAPCPNVDWRPLPSERCSGVPFTQVSECGQTRTAMGTGPETWNRQPSDVCAGETFTATSTCGNTSANQVGTKNCSCNVTRPLTWTETISGTTYSCTESPAANSVLQNGQTLVVNTPTSGGTSGNAEYVCNQGELWSTRQICNPNAKSINCNIHYKLNFDHNSGQNSNGNWINMNNGAKENCGSAGCYLTMGISCPNTDSEVRLEYQFMVDGGWSPLGTTPWSGIDNVVKWGPSVRRKTGNDDECGAGGCGLRIRAETRSGGTCSVNYGWGIENIRRMGSDWSNAGFYCTNKKGSPRCEEHACNEPPYGGCGMVASITCTI